MIDGVMMVEIARQDRVGHPRRELTERAAADLSVKQLSRRQQEAPIQRGNALDGGRLNLSRRLTSVRLPRPPLCVLNEVVREHQARHTPLVFAQVLAHGSIGLILGQLVNVVEQTR